MPTTPTLGGTTLPDPTQYSERVQNLGGYREMADGSIIADLVQANGKRTITLQWRYVTNAQKANIITAWATTKSGSATFRPPTYDVLATDYTVTRDPANPVLEMEAVNVPSGGSALLRWNITMTLRQA